MYLPRICEHCLNPSCVASCPSGRDVQARGGRDRAGRPGGLPRLADVRLAAAPTRRSTSTSTGKAEKCTLCYPRIEAGLPTVCSETCVGRIRYLGLVLYDADRVEAAASTPDEQRPARRPARRLPRPRRPRGARARPPRRDRRGLARGGAPLARLRAGAEHRIALPLHPEYRTLPMVWYVPPLSPVDRRRSRATARRPTPTTSSRRSTSCGSRSRTSPTCSPPATPSRSAASLQAAGRDARLHARARVLGEADAALAAAVGMSADELERMFRLLAIAKYDDRYVIPRAHTEAAGLHERQGSCGIPHRRSASRGGSSETRLRLRPCSSTRTRAPRRARRAGGGGGRPTPGSPFLAWPRERRSRAAGRVRRDLRLRPAREPPPHLPHARRQAPARARARPAQAPLRRGGPAARRRRAAGLPAGDARVRRPRAGGRRGAAGRAPRGARARPRAPARAGEPVRRGCSTRSPLRCRAERAQVERARRLAAQGPPAELVGLEPFAAGAPS